MAAMRLAHCSSAAEALHARLGPAGPVWAWCALGALSGWCRCLSLGGEVDPSRTTARLLSPARCCRLPCLAGHTLVFMKRRIMVMVTSKSWRLSLDEARWVCSVAPGCGRGREKSLSACPTMARCRLWFAPFLPEGRRGNPCPLYPMCQGNPRTSGPGSSAENGGSFLKVLLGTGRFGVLGVWWSKVGGRHGCESSLFC